LARAKRQLFKPEGKKQSHQIYEDRREAVFLFVQFNFCDVRYLAQSGHFDHARECPLMIQTDTATAIHNQ
jgi:hypothetical protein